VPQTVYSLSSLGRVWILSRTVGIPRRLSGEVWIREFFVCKFLVKTGIGKSPQTASSDEQGSLDAAVDCRMDADAPEGIGTRM
jgi:hypothetical protein